MEKMNKDMLIWLSYNTGRNTNLRDEAINLPIEYNRATKGNHKYCQCERKPSAVNEYWNEWHCTYCLKPKQ